VLKSAAGQVQVCRKSAHCPYSEDEAGKILAEKDIEILVDMGGGPGAGSAWGCDLTYDYVKINGDYRS
jgi:glutamate N-acetyltransferase/amino-acid N-acetyltransferase